MESSDRPIHRKDVIASWAPVYIADVVGQGELYDAEDATRLLDLQGSSAALYQDLHQSLHR